MIDIYALTKKEIQRFFRVWKQTILPPAITTILYLLVFWKFVGSKINSIEGFSYIDFIFPGLLMMSVIMASYSNTSSSFFGAKFQKNIEELYVSSISPIKIVLGFVLWAMCRGLIVGAIVVIIWLFFTNIKLQSFFFATIFLSLSSCLFATIGLINGVFAKSFDDVTIIPNFLITPLIYLWGVFYSLHTLPELWQWFTIFNPVYYMINGLRYSFLEYSEVPILTSIAVLAISVILALYIAYFLIKKWIGVKS